ncbi:MAG: DJ-1 family glyoxalase III [Candidatus Syntropharchaeia archaeon]
MKVFVPLAEGFEEIEFSTIVDILRRAEADVTTVGLKENPIEGSHGVKVFADISIDNLKPEEFDAIVLPGGYPGFVNLGEDQRVLDLVKKMYEDGKYVAAICGAPSVLSKAGILEGKKATIHPAVVDMLTSGEHVDERVVVDGKIITSMAPGSAMEFAMKLVEIFFGKEKVEAVNEEVLAKIP